MPMGGFPDFGALDGPEFRVIPGVEYYNATLRYGQSRAAFVLGLNTLEVAHWRPGLGQQRTIDAITEDGGLAILCCTYWDGRTAGEMVNLKNVTGIEIYNATCENSVCKGNAVMHWDELLESGMRVYGLAVDDCHFSTWDDFALAWIVVSVSENTPAAITNAIGNGHFYSSCGPTIEQWRLHEDKMTFRCSPVEAIVWNGVAHYGKVFRDPGGGLISEAVLDLKKDIGPETPYVRFSCRDADGHWAWTNAFWLDEHRVDC